MKALLFLCSGITAVMALSLGFDIGQMAGGKSEPFEYVSASTEQRENYLNRLAGPMERDIKRSMINPSGVGPKLFFKGTELYPDTPSIQFKIMIAGGQVRRSAMNTYLRKATKQLCKGYVGTELSKNRVIVVQKFIDSDHKSLGRVTVSNSKCENLI